MGGRLGSIIPLPAQAEILMAINVGGQEYTAEELIALIAESDNDLSDDPGVGVFTPRTLEEIDGVIHSLDGVVHALEHRVAQLEARLPISHAGYGVAKTVGSTATTYRVQMLDYTGTPVTVTFDIPNAP